MLRAAETIERTDTGRQRRGNEDSMFVSPPVFVVADGMGGAQAGEVASRIAVEAFKQGLPDSGPPEEQLATRVREANTRIYERARSEQQLAGMGTTLTAAYIVDAHIAIAHVGDSRAYLYRDGSLTRLTRDHSLVEELVLEGKLTEEQAAEHPQRSIITRALGPERSVQVDTWRYPGRGGDVLLLCSDGLTSMVPEERISEVLGSAANLRDAADRLIDEANDAGGRDNITVVLFRLEEVGADGQVEEPTIVGGPAPSSISSPRGTSADAAPATDDRAAARVPLARTQGRGDAAPDERPRRRWAKPLAAVLATLIVLGLLGAGGYLATRQLYFVGTNSQGIVTIFRGLPYDLPAGVHLYETYYVSGVPASLIPNDRRSSLLNHNLRSQSDTQNLVRALELGQLSR
jgi:PPM family protein phosphatase